MKILFLTNSFERIVNGPAKFANYLLEINAWGLPHEIRILTEDVSDGRFDGETGPVYPMRLRIPGWLSPIGQWIRMRQYYERAVEIRKTYPWDILVYINAFNGWYATRVSPWPVAGMINDDNNLNATLSSPGKDKLWLKRAAFRPFEVGAARRMRLILSNSDFLTKEVIEAYDLPPQKVKRLYKSIDFKGIDFKPERQFAETINILFVKADYRRGGLPVLIEALQQISDRKFNLTVIGPAEGFRQAVEGLVPSSASIKLKFLAEQPQKKVMALMAEADIFCVPSLQEALGIANMEAAAYGTPVVSTTAGGIPEAMDEGRAAFLAEPGNVSSLADCLRECIANPSLRMQKQVHAYDYVRRTFDKEKMLKDFLAMVEEACFADKQ